MGAPGYLVEVFLPCASTAANRSLKRPPQQKIIDYAELSEHHLLRRKEFEDLIRRIRREELKRCTQSLVEQSPTLSCPGAETRTKRDLKALRWELEGPVLERAAKAAWDLIYSKEGLGKKIADTVDAVYHKLAGQEFN